MYRPKREKYLATPFATVFIPFRSRHEAMDPPIPFRAGVAGAFLHPTWKTGTTTHESTASEVLYLYTARSGRGLYQSSRPPDFHANQRADAGDVTGFSGCHTLGVGKSGFC